MNLTLKANRPKGDTRGFVRGGVNIPASWVRFELDDNQVKAIKKEAARETKMILVGDDLSTKDLISIINRTNGLVAITALADCKPDAKTVQAAAVERLDVLGFDASMEAADPVSTTKAEMLAKISEATTKEALNDLADEIMGWGIKEEHEELSAAWNAREEALKG